MARDAHGINVAKWGATGAAGDFSQPTSPRASAGFDQSFSLDGGNTVSRTEINFVLRALTALAREIGRQGIPFYDSTVDYAVGTVVSHGGKVWRSAVVNGPATDNTTSPGSDKAWNELLG